MINIQYCSFLVVSISLFFLIIYQIPNSYSQLYSNENFANMDEKQGESKETFSNNNNNNNENYFDNGSDNLKTDNLNDKNSYPNSDNNKLTNNIMSSQASLSKEDHKKFNLKDYAQSIKQLYKKQTNNQELDSDKSLYYKQNNDSNNTNNIKDDLNQSFEVKKLLKDQKYSYEDFSKEGINNNNAEYKEEDIPYSSVNDNDGNNKNVEDNNYDTPQSSFKSSGSKSISSQNPSVDTHYVQVFDKNGNFMKSWGDTG